jgi:hypothetical protein
MDIRFIGWSGYQLADCATTTVSGVCGYGTIELEYGWQLVSVPITHGYWNSVTHEYVHDDVTVAKFKNYILDQIEDLYGAGVVEVANTYTGDQQAFYSYVVGSTPESSPNNFQLVYDDSGNYEIAGFWIKVIGGSAPYIITWGEE